MTPHAPPCSTVDLAVVGGGIVGLATAAAFLDADPGLRVVVLEKEAEVGLHQTGHNSGVVHSGLYYRPGSAKARTCLSGAARMRAFCAEHAVPFAEVGKVVVATSPAELPRLGELERRAHANGVPGVRRIDADALHDIEPHASGIAALHVPHAAITDYAAVARALQRRIVQRGGLVSTGTRAIGFARRDGLRTIRIPDGEVAARLLVTCAGLHSDRVCARAEAIAPTARIVPFRGEYHVLDPRREELVRGLIYPVPDPRFPFLGVHFTRMIHGGVECGPNAVLAFRREGYHRLAFSLGDAIATAAWPGFWRLARRYWAIGAGEYRRSFSRRAFATALQRLVPEVRAADLRPGGSGVRAQALDRSGSLVDDFLIVDGDRSLHVVNAPSPAATASLAIADEIVARARERGLVRGADGHRASRIPT